MTSPVAGAYTGGVMRTMNTTAIGIVALLMVLGSSATASAQQVQLAIENGRVTLVAKDATIRQILTEWARVGQTKVVNVEKIPGGPVTLELTNVSEDEALDVLLRSVSGYMTAPLPTAVAGLSQYDRILVMPTSATPPRATPAEPAAVRQPLLPQPGEADAADEPPPANVGVPPRGPVFTAFPQPQIVSPQQGAPGGGPANGFVPQVGGQAPSPSTNSPQPASPVGGVSVPGMIVPPPAQPGQQPGAPTPQR